MSFPVGGYLGGLHVLPVVNSAEMDVHVQALLWYADFTAFDCISRTESADFMEKIYF